MRFRWEKSCDKKILNFFSELKVFKNLNFKKADILLFDTHFTQICNFYEFDSKIFLEKIQIFFEKKTYILVERRRFEEILLFKSVSAVIWRFKIFNVGDRAIGK